MLQQMRSAAKWIWWFVVIAFVGGFLLLDTSGLLGRDQLTTSTVVATVNGVDVPYLTWANLSNALAQQREQATGRGLNLDERRAIEDEAFEQLVNDILLQQEYRRRGILVELTHPQYLVLLVLWAWARDGEPRPTVKALGTRLALDSGTLTPLLKRLESRGLITRTRSTSDERELFVHVTAAGLELKRRAHSVPVTLLRRSPLQLADVVRLREELKRLRMALAG